MFSCLKNQTKQNKQKKNVSFLKLHLGWTMMLITQINYDISYIDTYGKFRARKEKVKHDILHVNSSGNENIIYNKVSISLAPRSLCVLRQCVFLQMLGSESNQIEYLFSISILF